jgi:leucyl aminopeptidase
VAELISTLEIATSPGELVVGLFDGPTAGRGAEAVMASLGIDILRIAGTDPAFTGAEGQLLTVVTLGVAPIGFRLVGLGAPESISTPVLRRAAMRAGAPTATVSLLALESPNDDVAAAVVEGHRLGGWRYGATTDGQLAVVGEGDTARAERVARATNWVRELVEMPPNLLTPAVFAERIRSFAVQEAPGLITVTNWDVALLAERGFGGTLGVGSAERDSTLAVELRYTAEQHTSTTAIAGKGITFDSGGINLKRDPSEIAWMKSDMAAAAAVAAAVITAAATGSRRSLHALLPITQNMPGSRAQRPGDVVTHPDGRTTEVTDTDSEGRLVLADALAWLAATHPDELIDVGTLTDSGSLGTEFWGCWSTSAALADALVAAGERSGDRGWRLPLHDGYAALLASRVADLANAPTDAPDTGVVAASYLRSFVGDVPWAHIDNGSGAWLEHDAPPWPEGPTGTPARALIEFLAPASE